MGYGALLWLLYEFSSRIGIELDTLLAAVGQVALSFSC
jgi:hypothetical protein